MINKFSSAFNNELVSEGDFIEYTQGRLTFTARIERDWEVEAIGQGSPCGVIVAVTACIGDNNIELDSAAASLWGLEANQPDGDNSHLTTVANELLPEANKLAQHLLKTIKEMA